MQLFLSPDFNIKTLRKKPKSAEQKFKEWHQKIQDQHLTSLAKLLGSYVPQTLFEREAKDRQTRQRIFTVENTFWGFLLQTLQADSSCQSIVHQLKAKVSKTRKKTISSSTSAYCQARAKLSHSLLQDIFAHTANHSSRHPLVNRRVVCADGTGLLASDTLSNQQRWPQQRHQKSGCAFPQLRLCGLFDLHSGRALSYRIGSKRSHELPLLREQESTFQAGDVFIGDKGFICFYDQARLLELGVDSIVALARRRPVLAGQSDKVLGENDLLISVPKFTSQTARNRYPKTRWDALPNRLQMRQIKVDIAVPGYRTQQVYLLTTLLDQDRYPAHKIAELYRQRWRVELFFRDLKTTMGMEFIDAKTPAMVEKTIQMFFIAYNLVRTLMCHADTENQPTGLSFKACIQIVLAFSKTLDDGNLGIRRQRTIMYKQIASARLLSRDRRCEPRVVKRRPKPFKMMMKPRAELRNDMLKKAA